LRHAVPTIAFGDANEASDMILVGQYDSPFVRRVGVTLLQYRMPFTRDRTSVFSPKMATVNPLVRIPSLVLDDGETLFDSAAILDYLDEQVAPATALTPRSGEPRRQVLRAIALAVGAIEKAGAVVYERHLHGADCISTEWVERALGQLAGALSHLDGKASEPWFFGEKMTQADVTIGCAVGYLRLRLEEAFPLNGYRKLGALAARCNALDEFVRTQPAPDEVMPPKGTARRS
jgi:glutathione S-transferase